MAQRLVRKICAKCQEDYSLSAEELEKIKKALAGLEQKIPLPKLDKTLKLKRGRGCPDCLGTGYKGRIGIFEIIQINEQMERLINSSPSHIQIKDLAVKEGLINMYQDGLIKVLQGITTTEEVERVIGE